jgi:hypothetical protein
MEAIENKIQNLPSTTHRALQTSDSAGRLSSLQLATKATRTLLGCYRRGDPEDPETYIAAVTATLAMFPPHVIKHVTSPLTGLPSRLKFLPAVAEVRGACEDMIRAEEREIEWQRQWEARQLQEEERMKQEAARERERIAMCHLWLRAAEIGDAKAEKVLRGYDTETAAAARNLTMAEAISVLPDAQPGLSKPVDQYGPLRDVDRKAA